jgi:purine-binding chemotaxis protein CheW
MVAAGQVMLKRKQYLTFLLGEEEYGFDVLKVKELMAIQPMEPVRNVPRHFKGVARVRGQIVLVISARLQLGMTEIGYTPQTCMILTAFSRDAWFGFVVDRVRDIVDVAAVDVQQPPFVRGSEGNEVIGLVRNGARATILLDVEELLINAVACRRHAAR